MKNNSWDVYFLRIAREVSKNSKCLSRQIGAVVVKDKNVVSTGYNEPAKGVKHCNERTPKFYFELDNKSPYIMDDWHIQCPRKSLGYKSGQGLHLCQAGHAERNALIQAAKHGISTNGASLYCYCPLPCMSCMIEIINAGIKELIFLKGKDYDTYSRILLIESKINYQEINEKIL